MYLQRKCVGYSEMKKKIKYSVYFLFGLLVALVSALSIIIYKLSGWVMETWGLLSIDEIIFHLKVPLEGTNTDVIVDGINACVPLAVMVFLMMITYLIGMKNKKIIAVLSMLLVTCVSVETGVKAAYGVYVDLGVENYLESQKNDSNFIQTEYVDPRGVSITFPEQKRNLIYIFLESMESSYTSVENGGSYEENYIPELTEVAKFNVNFSDSDKIGGGYTTVGSNWTMAGLFAQTSGLPLKFAEDVEDGNAVLGENSTFSSSAYNLEDILSINGYQQCFLLGSDATFGGRRAYFNSHGACEIWDILTAKELGKLPEDYYVWWGYEDAKLFTYAQEKLLEMSSTGEPFNLTLLTVDTHFEDGYVCEYCQNEFGDNQYANVLSCSSRQVAAFIEWIQQQPFYENTTIILSGDHLTMDSDFCEEIENNDRKVYNAFINLPEGLDISYEKTHDRKFCTMDMFPTTVAALGATIEGDKLGLGTNLFSDERTLVERFGFEQLNQELWNKSAFYEMLMNDIDY